MIKDVDILYTVNKVLDIKFGYKCFIQDNSEVVEVPTFFVSLSHLTSDAYLRWNEKLLNIYIIYTNEVVNIEELLDMQNKLDELFDMYLQVGKRKLVFDKKKFNRTKDFITLTLTLNYLDDKTNVPDAEKYTKKMEILNYRDGDK